MDGKRGDHSPLLCKLQFPLTEAATQDYLGVSYYPHDRVVGCEMVGLYLIPVIVFVPLGLLLMWAAAGSLVESIGKHESLFSSLTPLEMLGFFVLWPVVSVFYLLIPFIGAVRLALTVRRRGWRGWKRWPWIDLTRRCIRNGAKRKDCDLLDGTYTSSYKSLSWPDVIKRGRSGDWANGVRFPILRRDACMAPISEQPLYKVAFYEDHLEWGTVCMNRLDYADVYDLLENRRFPGIAVVRGASLRKSEDDGGMYRPEVVVKVDELDPAMWKRIREAILKGCVSEHEGFFTYLWRHGGR